MLKEMMKEFSSIYLFCDYHLSFTCHPKTAPYIPLRMNPTVPGDTHGHAHKDAMFFSMHKFVGGVQTPGKQFVIFFS